ncbi:MAG: flagellar basal body P-ring formation protein FlgA [Phycisphaerales bacterium]|nr:flagellar basal body P-ring formation protein FlgA [Phycisphaerales bacterium]
MSRQSRISLRRLGVLIAAACVGAFAGPVRGEGSVTLRSAVRLAPGAPARLGDIAALDGPDAAALGDVVILDAARIVPGAWQEIDLAQARRAIEAARPGAGSRVTFTGRACAVTALAPLAEPVPRDEPAPEPEETPFAPGTVGEAAERVLADTLGAAREDLRLAFDPSNAELLAMTLAGRSADIRLSGASSRVPLSITILEGDRIIRTEIIRVGVWVRRTVLVASRPLSRGALIDPDTFALQEQWLPPTATPLDPARAAGMELRTPIDAGAVLDARHVQPPVVVRRGDRVVVYVAIGSILIEEETRALSSAREGESIDFEALDGSRRIIRARVNGRGRAVAGDHEAPPEEIQP